MSRYAILLGLPLANKGRGFSVAILRLSARIWTMLLLITLTLVIGGVAARWLLPFISRANLPTVVVVEPASGAADVPLRADVRLRFSHEMNRSSVERALRIEPPVVGHFRWDDQRHEVAFAPDAPLTADMTYTLRLDQPAVGRLYAPLAAPFVASFHTVPAPVVVAALPGDTDVAVDSSIALVFSRPMVAPDRLDQLIALPQLHFEPALVGDIRWIDQTTLLFTPAQPLPPATTIRGVIDGALTDLSGTPLGQMFAWSFATVAPTLLHTSPAPGVRAVGPQQPLVLEFSQPIAPGAIDTGLSLTPPITGSITSAISGTGQLVTFVPDQGWMPNTTYTVAVGALRPLTGDRLLAPNSWSFSTAPPLTLVGRFPGQGQSLPNGQSLRLIFASAVDTTTLLSGLRLEPAAGRLQIVGNDAEVRIQADLRASTTYTLTLERTITDRTGAPLDKVYRLNFVTSPAPPALELSAVTGRFLSLSTEHVATIDISRTNLTALDMSLYQFDEATLLRVFGFTGINWRDFQPERYNLPQLRAWRVPLDMDQPGQLAGSAVPISAQDPPVPLPPGAYYLRVRSPEGPSADLVLLLSRTTLSLVTGARQSLVWASDGAGVPLADLPLTLYAGSSAVGRGRTDADGLWLVDRPLGGGPYLVLADRNLPPDAPGSGAVVSSDWTRPNSAGVGAERSDYRIALATDQSTYRPNGSILVGGFVRAIVTGSITAPAVNTNLDLSLRRLGTTDSVTRTSVRLDSSGVVSTSLALHKVLPGAYLVRATAGATVRDFPIQIVSDEPPPLLGTFIASDNQRVVFEATTSQGDPIVGAQVRWRIAGMPVAERLPPTVPVGTIVGDDQAPFAASIDQQGTGMTDGDGHVTIPLPGQSVTETTQLRIRVQAVESDGVMAQAETTVLIPASDMVIGIHPEFEAFVAPQTPRIDLFAFGRDGAPAGQTDLQIDVLRRTWDPALRETRVQRRTVATDDQGRASLVLDLRAGGAYRLVVTGRDGLGRVVRSADSLWAAPPPGAAPVSDWPLPPGGVLLVPDQPAYAPGTTANLLVGLTQPTTPLLVVTERSGVLTGTVRTIRPSELLSVPVPNGATGAATVSVLQPNGSIGNVGRVILPVRSPDAALHVTVASALASGTHAGPLRQTAVLTVTVGDDQDRPMQSDLIVAISPEQDTPLTAIDAAELTRSPRPALPSLAQTSSIAPEGSVAATSQSPGPALSVRPPSENVYTTEVWRAGIATGADGSVRLELPLPSGIARWRVSVRARAATNLFGQATSLITTTQPLRVQPIIPANLGIGDQVTIGLLVQNTSDLPVQLSAMLASTNLTVTQQPSPTVQLAAQSRQLIDWNIQPDGDAPGVVTFTLRIDTGLTSQITRTLAIRPERMRSEQQTLIGPMRFTRSITNAQEARLDRLVLAVAPTAIAAISRSHEWLRAYTERSVEQEASLVGLSAVLQQTRAVSGTTALSTTIDQTRAVLVASQQPDGGWGWWPDSPSNSFVTGYVLEMLSSLPGENRRLPANTQDRALAYLAQQARLGTDSDLQAYLLYILSLYNQDQTATARSLLQTRIGRPLEADGLAYLALMLPPDDANVALDRLTTLAQRPQAPADLSGEVFWNIDTIGALPRSKASITALALRAFERSRPDSALIEGAQRTLAHAWSVDGWPTAYDSARAAAALVALPEATSATAPVSVTAMVDGRRLILPTPSGIPTTSVKIDLPLAAHTQSLSIERAGNAGSIWPVVAYRITYHARAVPDGRLQGIALLRDYLDPTSGARLDSTDLRRGQLVRVRLTLVVASTQMFVTLHEPRTAALDPLSLSPAAPFEHLVRADDALHWSATRLAPGMYTQTYLARVGQPGLYLLQPASLTATYQPGLALHGSPQRAIVR